MLYSVIFSRWINGFSRWSYVLWLDHDFLGGATNVYGRD